MLFVRLQGKRLEERSKQGRQRSATFRGESGGGGSLSLSPIQTGFWIRGGSRAFARISSRTLGRYVVVTNPAPPRCRSNGFQRISGALQTTPEEPRQRNGPLGAPKRRPDPPQPAPHPPRLVCGGNHGAGTHWCPSGGAPRWRRPGRRRPKPSRFICGNAQGP